MPSPLHTLKIWGAGVYSPRSYGAEFVFLFVCFLFICPLRYDARHRKPRRCVYALNLGGTGISPPDKSPHGQNTPRTKAPSAKNPPGQKCPRVKDPRGKSPPGSGDIFYCSGIRQLNHSSCLLWENGCNRLYSIQPRHRWAQQYRLEDIVVTSVLLC